VPAFGMLDACMASGGPCGYAVNFGRLIREQQRDVVSRTFHGSL
jgi:autonomous glycyl radical cofactor GrcA